MDTVVDNEFVSVWVYPEKGIIRHKFHKFIFGDKFRDGLMDAADAFEKYHCVKWLSDDRNNSAILPEDTEWAQNHWEPRIMKAGWKYWALILPEKVVGQMNMNRLVKRYSDLGVNVKVFSEPTEAMHWLERQ